MLALHVLTLVLAVPLLLLAVERLALAPFLALLGVAFAYGLAADHSGGYIAQAFGTGFGQVAETAGLALLAGMLAAVLAERAGAAARLPPPRGRALLALGLLAGATASATAAFAVLAPLLRAIPGARPARDMAGLALPALAAHGLLLPAPPAVAAMAILGAEPGRMLLYGLPATLLAAAGGWIWAWYFAGRTEAPPAAPAVPLAGPRGLALALLPVAASLALLLVSAFGHIPSEPLGGGGTRAMLLGLGRPALLLAVAAALALLLLWRRDAAVLGERGWVGEALLAAMPILLAAAAAAGFARVLQNTGMPELAAERLLGLPLGLLLPFLAAAVLRALQGSMLVAVIAAAGMVEPLLPALGLDGADGRALAALAVGAGALGPCHVVDPYFWLAGGLGRFGPARGLLLLGGGSLLQGVLALALLASAAALAT